MQHHSRLRRIVVTAGALGLLSLAGCGSSSSSDNGSTTSASSDGSGESIVAEAAKTVEQTRADVKSGVPKSGPAVAQGKSIILIPCAQAGEGCAQPAEGAAEAAKAIGWKAQIIDGKGTAETQSAAIEQAVALKPDAIVLFAIDPTTVQGAVASATKAAIPVIGSSAVENPLLAFSDNPSKANWELGGKAAADYIIEKTDGKAQVLVFTDNEFNAVNQRSAAFEAELARCSGCKIVKKANFNFADLGSGVPQLVQQTAQANPSFNAIYAPYDAAVPAFLQGLQAVGATDKLVLSGDGTSTALKCIREQCGQTATVAFPLRWIGWADIDAANRIFNDEDPSVATADLPVKLIDKENVPTKAGTWDGDYDFQAAYKKLWKVD